jgi:outer membrane autotransporter protein
MTTGDSSYGIWIWQTGDDVAVDASGSITTGGTRSHGIYINNTVSDVAITGLVSGLTRSRRSRPWLNIIAAYQEVDSGAAFHQKISRLEAGVDSKIEAAGGRLILGAFGGLGHSAQEFAGSATEANADTGLAGAYVGYRKGGHFGDIVAKYEHQWTRFSSVATNDRNVSFEIDMLGLSLESGYRFDGRVLYLQPHVGLDYARAWIGYFADASGTTIDLRNSEALSAEFVTRVGAALSSANLYFDAGIRREFLGKAQAEVSGLSYVHELPGTAGLLTAGIVLGGIDNRLSLTFEGGYTKSNEAEEFKATTAMRLMF